MLTLYLKTHNKTGKKYLGKTNGDAFKYSGSGVDWKKHLEENGKEVTTEILYQTEDKSRLKSQGKYYSKLWDIVASTEFLNLQEESGGGCGSVWTEERREKFTEDAADRIWINNGTESKRMLGGYVPEGWQRGRPKGHSCNRPDINFYFINSAKYSYREAKEKYGTRFTKAVTRMNRQGVGEYTTRKIRGYTPLTIASI
tara:strand:- start:7 stop:603 length:597 start_codon:yes stop_codon:yes gene_type:complete